MLAFGRCCVMYVMLCPPRGEGPRCIHGTRNASSNRFATARTVACTLGLAMCRACPSTWIIYTAHVVGRACTSAALGRQTRSHTLTPQLAPPTRGPPCTARRCDRLSVGPRRACGAWAWLWSEAAGRSVAEQKHRPCVHGYCSTYFAACACAERWLGDVVC